MLLTHATEVGVVLGYLSHVEEGDEGLISGADQKELKGVIVERNALQSRKDRVQGGSASN